MTMHQTTVRSTAIPAWRAVWRSTFPAHGLSWNKYLERAIDEWIDAAAGEANITTNAKSNITGVEP